MTFRFSNNLHVGRSAFFSCLSKGHLQFGNGGAQLLVSDSRSEGFDQKETSQPVDDRTSDHQRLIAHLNRIGGTVNRRVVLHVSHVSEQILRLLQVLCGVDKDAGYVRAVRSNRKPDFNLISLCLRCCWRTILHLSHLFTSHQKMPAVVSSPVESQSKVPRLGGCLWALREIA